MIILGGMLPSIRPPSTRNPIVVDKPDPRQGKSIINFMFIHQIAVKYTLRELNFAVTYFRGFYSVRRLLEKI